MKTGIGLLDLYDDDSLTTILNQIPENTYITVVSNRNTSFKDQRINKHIVVDKASIAHMRNLILHDFRINNLDYYYLIHTDQIIKDFAIFNNIQKISETFGTWFLSGHVDNNTLNIEDDNGSILKISKKLNTKFIFTFKGIIKNFGFFDEQIINSHDLDVYDYIQRLKNKSLYPKDGYFPSISTEMKENKKRITNSYIQDYPSEENSVKYAYGYFLHKNKHIPNQETINYTTESDESVLKTIEFLQNNYGKK
jgi:hypothetical protein